MGFQRVNDRRSTGIFQGAMSVLSRFHADPSRFWGLDLFVILVMYLFNLKLIDGVGFGGLNTRDSLFRGLTARILVLRVEALVCTYEPPNCLKTLNRKSARQKPSKPWQRKR